MSSAHAPAVTGMPQVLLRIEGFGLFAIAAFLYWGIESPWWLFLILFLAPDLSFAAYGFGPRIGAWAYNLTHVTMGPMALAMIGLWQGSLTVVAVALIWLAHVGLDRALGFGLKYPTAFRDTHLGRLGQFIST